ncbi:unnamed protein product [Sphagnum jensenii]|uniref:Kelch repeat-containing F-box family protein n=1 Tax=Sphagnum jensenii TaxID=128206 RepID=A0ABP1ABM1_9BRYO
MECLVEIERSVLFWLFCNSCASKSRAFRKRPIRPVATGGSDWNAHSNRGRGGREAERKVSTGKGEWRRVRGCCGGCPCREEEDGFVSERVRARAVEYGSCGIIFKQGSIEWCEGEEGRGDEDGAGSSGRGRKRSLRGGGVANGVLATFQGSTTSDDARTEAPGVDGEGRKEVTEARKRDGIKEESVYMPGAGEGPFGVLSIPSGLSGGRYQYDLQSNNWSQAPKMLHDSCLFGSANTGKNAYFAGGSAQQVTLQSAERYNSETQECEALPDLHSCWTWCSGCILDGHFLVVGGQDQDRVLTSAEYYDEIKNQWVLIENMWPASHTPLVSPAPPLLAVVDNELYAVDATTMELKSYQKDIHTWQTLGCVPNRSVDSNGWGVGFKAVGKDIFVIGGSRGKGHFCNKIHACNLESNAIYCEF